MKHGRSPRRTVFWHGLLAMVVVRIASAALSAAPAPAPGSAGMVVSFRSLATPDRLQASEIDRRISRLVALYVPHDEAPSSFTTPGPFEARFEGDLNLRLRDFLAFSAQGRGKLTLTINGKQVLQVWGDPFPDQATDYLRLAKGRNHLVAVYESPAAGDAEMRLYWSSRTFRPEPIPPMALTHDPAEALNGEQARAGRFLFTQFRCMNCHAATPPARSAMPELRQDAPSLADAGARLNEAWMTAWIDNPRGLRADAHMPRLFADGSATRDSRAADIAAYLASLGKSGDSSAATADGSSVTDGGRLYAHLNCVGCHTLGAPRSGTANAGGDSRVPLQWLSAKFRPLAMRDYLKAPESHYAWNPMPNFRLSDREAADLAAFLLAQTQQGISAASHGDADRGRSLVQSSGCLNCHVMEKLPSPLKAPALEAMTSESWSRGCMASDAGARKNAPLFEMTVTERDALRSFATSGRLSAWQDVPEEFARRQMTAMRCNACHARDASESLIATVYDSESTAMKQEFAPVDVPGQPLAADQRAPLLTWAGEKLLPEWMDGFISGRLDEKPRPFLRARMPAFASRAAGLARGLAREHGYAPAGLGYPKPDAAQAAIGQKLTGVVPNESFGCVQCHSVAAQPPKAPFEAPSINFVLVTQRLRKEYYHRWMHDPLRVDPATKMPRFDDADGKTGITSVHGGDSRRQFEAIWQYLLEGRSIQLPP